jgi:hypothetical protein
MLLWGKVLCKRMDVNNRAWVSHGGLRGAMALKLTAPASV